MRSVQLPIKDSTRLSGHAVGLARSSGFAAWQPYDYKTSSRFRQVSIGHPGPPYKTGGNWFMERTTDERNSVQASSNFIEGTYMLLSPTFSLTGPQHTPKDLTQSEVNEIGTDFFKYAGDRTITPVFDGAVALGELYRDGFPKVVGSGHWREKALSAHNAGSEYLNYEFGWKPFVSDLKDFARVVLQGDHLWKEFVRKANTWQKISRSYSTQADVRSGVGSFTSVPTAVNVFAYGNATETNSTKTWCEGYFRYYLPMGDDTASNMRRFAQKARYLYGARLTPDVVWNIAPWSWAADWFSNVGDILTNLSNMGPDGLVGKEVYMMRHYRRDTRAYAVPVSNNKGVPRSPLYIRSGYEGKTRRTASPFGFGLSWDDLTPRQVAIAVALGGALGGSGLQLSK